VLIPRPRSSSWAITRAELLAMVEAVGFAVTWHAPEEAGYGQHLLLGGPTG
jgi:hypothetical protein